MDDWWAALDKIQEAYGDQGIAPAVIRGQDETMPDELLAAVYNHWGDKPYMAQRMFYFDENWDTHFTDEAVKEGFADWAKLLSMGPIGATSFTWYECVNQFAAGNAATYWFDASLFAGTFEDVCEFMAGEYQANDYEKIVLAGPYADAVEDRVRAYSKVNYNFNNINIEVIK
jgi:hypothetical protein